MSAQKLIEQNGLHLGSVFQWVCMLKKYDPIFDKKKKQFESSYTNVKQKFRSLFMVNLLQKFNECNVRKVKFVRYYQLHARSIQVTPTHYELKEKSYKTWTGRNLKEEDIRRSPVAMESSHVKFLRFISPYNIIRISLQSRNQAKTKQKKERKKEFDWLKKDRRNAAD